MIRRRKAARAERRRAKRTLENALARERAQDATEAEEEEFRPRVGRHVGQLDHLLTQRSITEDMARAGHRFSRDFERSLTAPGRLIGRYEAEVIRQPNKWAAPPDTPMSIAARERFEAAVAALGPLWSVTFHVAVLDQPAESWGVPPERHNGDAMALLRLGLATLTQHYGSKVSRGDRRPRMSAGPAQAAAAAPV